MEVRQNGVDEIMISKTKTEKCRVFGSPNFPCNRDTEEDELKRFHKHHSDDRESP